MSSILDDEKYMQILKANSEPSINRRTRLGLFFTDEDECRKVGFSSAEVSGVGRRRGPAAAVGFVVPHGMMRGRRRGVRGGGELHHATCAHRAARSPEIRFQYGIGV